MTIFWKSTYPLLFFATGLILTATYTCRNRSSSTLRITNGIDVVEETDETRPVIALYEVDRVESNDSHCSATLLNDTTLLTAAHCVEKLDVTQYSLSVKGQVKAVYLAEGYKESREASERSLLHMKELYASKSWDSSTRYESEVKNFEATYVDAVLRDLAILVVDLEMQFKESIKTYYGISSTLPGQGSVVLLQGYGLDWMENTKPTFIFRLLANSHKRYGFTQVIANLGQKVPIISGFKSSANAAKHSFIKGIFSSTAFGDSGGPTIDCGAGVELNESITIKDCASYRINSVNSRSYLFTRAEINGKETEVTTMASAPVSSDIAKKLFHDAINCGGPHCAKPFTGYVGL